MSLPISVKNRNGDASNIHIEKYPDSCPLCHTKVHPIFVDGRFQGPQLKNYVQLIFQCTNNDCEKFFIADFQLTSNIDPQGNKLFNLNKTSPVNPIPQNISTEVIDISPDFKEIYDQAFAAEAFNLTEIQGIGLRKALEFLIKDFAIKYNEGKIEEIKKALLSKCITNYIDDQSVKDCAKRAAWLGNDETHYFRKWEDKDINDLKTLIRLTINAVENFELKNKYLSSMPDS